MPICVNLGFFSGMSSCECHNFDMVKSQLSVIDGFTAVELHKIIQFIRESSLIRR